MAVSVSMVGKVVYKYLIRVDGMGKCVFSDLSG